MYRTHIEPGHDLKLRTIIFQFGGYASMAWETPERAGEFQYGTVESAAEAVVGEIKTYFTFELSRLLDKTGTASEWNAAIEAALRAIERSR